MIEKDVMEQEPKQLPMANRAYERGQALVEYTLLGVLIILSFGLAIAATGPIIGDIFDNTVTNLIGGNDNIVGDLPDVEEFWLTVTWVATQTPEEVPLPTRTLPPPSITPTFGPSPTPTPVTPTRTHTPTNTPTPSPTPQDIIHPFGFSDSADVEMYWRIDDTFYTGSGRWHAIFYRNPNLEPHENPARAVFDAINFDWGNGAPVEGYPVDQWSAIFRRQFTFSERTTLNIDIPNIDDGIRIWILGGAYGGNPDVMNGGPGTCADAYTQTSGRRGGSAGFNNPAGWRNNFHSSDGWSRTVVFGDSTFGYNPDTDPDSEIPRACVIVDRWTNGSSNRQGIQRTVLPGTYTIMIEYYENTGAANMQVNFSNLSVNPNPDDRRVDNAGNVVDTNANCNWGPAYHNERPNSLFYMFEEYRQGNFPRNNRCYLELRGAVEIPVGATSPALTFWDVWDLRVGSSAWVEIADYDPNDDGVFDRSALTWNRIDLHTNDTFNYNWTYQHIDLSAYAGRKVTFRFGMENRDSGSRNDWKIDSIRVDTTEYPDLYMDLRWDLNDPAQKDDFITSGQWALTGQHVMGGTGLSFHESPGYNTARMNWLARNTNNNNYEDGNMRMHTIEFKGFIDLMHPDGLVDSDGDAGDPILTFFHMYELHNRIGLEIQYTTDPYGTVEPNWQVVPGGELVPRSWTSGDNIMNIFDEVTVNLAEINESRFRLRFAMVVHPNATRRDGWWIDEIRLQRDGIQRYMRYPFIDTVEDPLSMDKWLRSGTWNRVPNGRRPAAGTTGYAYHDSPGGDYAPSSNNALTLLDPFDLFLNTPENPRSPTCNLGDDCETPDVAPVNPVLTFWHWRDLAANADFFVEWKRLDEDASEWRVLWAYTDGMLTQGDGRNNRTRVQRAWERVEIDLAPIMSLFDPDDPYDDDVLFRFRLHNRSSSSTAEGVYIDDIRLEDRQERVFYLWEAGQLRSSVKTGNPTLMTRDGSQPAIGNGLQLHDSLDNNPDLFNGAWHFGGDWNVITWEQREGLFAFHDSPVGQSEAEPHNSTPITEVASNTFSVLEMATIIDLRGVSIAERPMLSFWHRYSVNNNAHLRVEVAYQDLDNIQGHTDNCRNSGEQCYDKLYGWSEWEPILFSGSNDHIRNTRNWTWHLEQIPLETYAAQADRDGYRIRIRFVVDGRGGADRDGWYIDEIRVKHFEHNLRRTPINKVQAGATLLDSARNMRNWIGEGLWGLDPEFFRGSGGGPASLGASVWSYQYFDLRSGPGNSCPSTTTTTQNARACASAIFDNGEYATIPAYQSGIVLEINNDFGRGGPGSLRDYFAGRWTLTTGEVGTALPAGTYTFVTASDDGVRLRYDTYPTPGGLPPPVDADDPAQSGWNIIDNWQDQGRTTRMGTAKLATGNRYQFILEWYEAAGDAVIILSTGSTQFSFTDSPKQGSGTAFPSIPARMFSSSSLLYNGVFDFSLAQNPVIQYYTYHELGGRARVELSRDGGFSWEVNDDTLRGRLLELDWIGGWNVEYYHGNAGGGSNDVLDVAGDFPVVIETLSDDQDLMFNWGNGRPHPDVNADHFSSRWRRDVVFTEPTRVRFSIRHDDGIRLWVNYSWGCVMNNSNVPVVSGRSNPSGIGNSDSGFSDTGCLVINNWRSGNRDSSGEHFFLPGTYTIQIDHFEGTGRARVELYETRAGGFDQGDYGGTYMPNNGDWRLKSHDLSAYAGLNSVGLRFRLDRTTTNDNRDGWWVVDILVTDP